MVYSYDQFLFLFSMDKPALVPECNRIHLALSKANADNYDLKRKLSDQMTRIKNLSQKVLDKEKANQKLRDIVDNLYDVENISEETAALLKVN